MAKRDLHNVLFPKQRKILTQFGEDLLLAMKRRGFTKKLLCERTGFDHKTVNKVFAGDPGVAIGTYLKVMAVLGMESNFAEIRKSVRANAWSFLGLARDGSGDDTY